MLNKIQWQPNNYTVNKADKRENQSFKGAGTAGLSLLRGINNSPAIGACAVDLFSMVIPRTLIELKNRGKQAGIEAMFREGTSCFIHACVGLIGLGAGALISGKFNKKNNIKAQNIFANSSTIRNISSLWQNAQGQQDEFFYKFIENIKGLNGTNWKGVSQNVSDEVVLNMLQLANKTEQMANSSGRTKSVLAKEVKNLKNTVLAQITKDTGAKSSFYLNEIKDSAGNVVQKGVSAGLSELVDNAVVLSNSFKNKPLEQVSNFAKSLIQNKKSSTVLGLAICAALCMSVQPINRYLTKKRTGQDGFVGVDDKQANKSKTFKNIKNFAGIAFPMFAISTIGKPGDLLSNVQFNSKVPTINQFKLLYGLTIGSRFLAARDENELREGIIKDTLGFTNWLILGGVVSKLFARAIGGKELINNPIVDDGAKKGLKYAAKWLTKTSVKSYDEVLLPKAQELFKNGKLLKFSELFKNADMATKSKILKIAGSQIAGYLYSGLVLGVGIAKLNIYITKRVHAKRKADKNMNANINDSQKYDIEYLNKMQKKLSSVFKDYGE